MCCIEEFIPDTITVPQYVFFDTVSIDSLYQKLSAIQSELPKSASNFTISIWIPLIAAIIGGLLVWAGQAFERNRKNGVKEKIIDSSISNGILRTE